MDHQQIDMSEIVAGARARVGEIGASLAQCVPTQTIDLAIDTSALPAAERQLRELPFAKLPSVYWFELLSVELIDFAMDAYRSLKAAKSAETGLKLPSDNTAGKTANPRSTALYVGCSSGESSTITRLRQHLGIAGGRPCKNTKTYALNLAHWKPVVPLRLTLSVVQFERLDPDGVRLVEDALWNKKRPMLGSNTKR